MNIGKLDTCWAVWILCVLTLAVNRVLFRKVFNFLYINQEQDN